MKIDVLSLVKDGPVPLRNMRGRSAAFWLQYKRLLTEGQIIENGLGTRNDPTYFGLPGADFPVRRLGVNPADLCLLMLAGASEDEARKTLTECSTQEDVLRVCNAAHDSLLGRGLDLGKELRRATNRYRKGKPFVPAGTQYDLSNRPLAY